jgi:hypothetical protein
VVENARVVWVWSHAGRGSELIRPVEPMTVVLDPVEIAERGVMYGEEED